MGQDSAIEWDVKEMPWCSALDTSLKSSSMLCCLIIELSS